VRSIPTARQDRRNGPRPGQARAIGMATNFVASSDFNRISTVRSPFFRLRRCFFPRGQSPL
jgi:hypothetical protein